MADQASLGSRRRRPKRASQPCDACRRRKSRCVTKDNGSICTMCELRESACTYDSYRRRKGGSSGKAPTVTGSPQATSGDVVRVAEGRGVELASSQTPFATSALVPDATWPNEAGSILLGAPSMAGDVPGPALPASDHAPSPSSRPEPTVGAESDRFAELYGLTSDGEPILMRHRPYGPSDHEYRLDTHSIRRVQDTDNDLEYPVVFHMVADTNAPSHATATGDSLDADAIEAIVRPFGPRLLRLYTLLVQPAFPLLSLNRLVKDYSVSYRNVDPALLGAIYLKAMTWWSYDSELSLRVLPDVSRLRRLTINAIQHGFHRPRLSSIQAALLYLHCSPEEPLTPDHTYARGLSSQALAIGEAIGLHVNASGWSMPAWERAERKRLSWAIYMNDKWMALMCGRPSHIRDECWNVGELSVSDFEDGESGGTPTGQASNSTTAGTHFMFMVELTRIMSNAIDRFFTPQSLVPQDTAGLVQEAMPLLEQLSWLGERIKASFPMDVRRTRQLSSHGSLHLCYFGVVINVLRRLVRSTALAPLCLDYDVLSLIRQRASQAAHDAQHFVANLRPDQLDAFWFFPSPYLFSVLGSFQTLLLVTSLSTAERDYWRDALVSYLWTLRVMSKTSSSMSYAVNRLEGGVLRGLEHALTVNLDSLASPALNSLAIDDLLQQIETQQFTDVDVSRYGLQAFDWLAAG